VLLLLLLLRDCCVIYALHYTTSTEAKKYSRCPPSAVWNVGTHYLQFLVFIFSFFLLQKPSRWYRGRPSGRRRSWRDNEGSVRLIMETPPTHRRCSSGMTTTTTTRGSRERTKRQQPKEKKRRTRLILFEDKTRHEIKRWPTLWTWPSYFVHTHCNNHRLTSQICTHTHNCLPCHHTSFFFFFFWLGTNQQSVRELTGWLAGENKFYYLLWTDEKIENWHFVWLGFFFGMHDRTNYYYYYSSFWRVSDMPGQMIFTKSPPTTTTTTTRPASFYDTMAWLEIQDM
jgi:hypothetical protein